MLKRILLAKLSLTLITCLLAHNAVAATLHDNFNDGSLAGWPSPNVGSSAISNPGAGGNPGGYLQADRPGGNTSFYLSENYTGDWEALVGSSSIVVSVDLRVEDAGSIGTLRFEISNPTFSDIWRKDVFSGSPFPWDSSDGWVTFSYELDLNWTDSEANSNGWVRVFPSGSPQSFAQVVRNVKGNLSGFTLAGDAALTGLDNFSVSVPEPCSIAILLSSLVSVAASRRRSK